MVHCREEKRRKREERQKTQESNRQEQEKRGYKFTKKRNLVLANKDYNETSDPKVTTDGELHLCYSQSRHL